jgi:hypothetical protein
MPFVPYCKLTNEQQHCVKERRASTDETLKAFAFWITPDGSVADYGMRGLPVLPHRDGKHYKPTASERS